MEKGGRQEEFLMTQDFALPYFSFAKHLKSTQKGLAMNKAELIEAVQKEMGADTTKRAAEEAVFFCARRNRQRREERQESADHWIWNF